MEEEQSGLELGSRRDAGFVGGGFMCYVIMLGPQMHFKNKITKVKVLGSKVFGKFLDKRS